MLLWGIMDIIINKELRKYTEGLERKDSDVTTIIIHGAGVVGSAKSMIKWMADGGIMPDGSKRESLYKKGIALTQYVVDKDGQVIELFNPHNWLYHSSTGKFDKHTIGIELINGSVDNSKDYKKAQYYELVNLIKFLMTKFNNIKVITGHGKIKERVTGGAKECPGKGFNWITFLALLLQAEIKIKNASSERLEIC